MEGNHYEAAISHYKTAVNLDETAWPALEGLARCAASRESWHESIKWQERAIEAVSPKISYMTGYLWPRISTWVSKKSPKQLLSTTLRAVRQGVRKDGWIHCLDSHFFGCI